MKILVDINHPAHVHYFKNFIWEMKKRGHDVLITASGKDVAYDLLDRYKLNYINMGTYGKSLIQKLVNIPIMDFKLYNIAYSYKPDIFIGFGSIRCAHVSKLIKKPCINLDDTEHSVQEHILYIPFTDAVLTPTCFKKNMGKKHIRYNGYTELAYLHPNWFTLNPSVLDEIGLSKDDLFIILRFVSWNASHDIGQHGIKNKVKLVYELERYGKVIISSEGRLPKELEKYKFKISPEKLHDLLYYATLYIGEGATTASECAILGTHAIYINTLRLGYTDEEEEKYKLVFNFSNPKTMEQDAFNKALELLKDPNLRLKGKIKRDRLLSDKIDVTGFLIDFVENMIFKA